MLTLRGRAAPPGGIIPAVHNILAVPPTNQEGFKGTSSLRDGVSTYLALTFGTLLSSQGTEASIEAHHRPLRAFPPLSPAYQTLSGPISTGASIIPPVSRQGNSTPSEIEGHDCPRSQGPRGDRSSYRTAPCSSGSDYVRRSAGRSQTTGPPNLKLRELPSDGGPPGTFDLDRGEGLLSPAEHQPSAGQQV